MNKDQQVYKNLALVLEKLYMSLFIGIFGALGGVYVLLFLVHENPIFWYIVIFFNTFIGGYSYYIIYTLRKTKTENVIDMILYLQIVFFMLITNNLYSFCSNSIFYPEIYEQLYLNNEVLVISFLSLFFISNYPKILAFSITAVVLMYYTIRYPTLYDFKFLLWIHIYVIVFFVWLVIQQTVLIDSFKERGERMEMTAVIMHDLRNYVYSLNDMKPNQINTQHEIVPNHLLDINIESNDYDNTMKFILNKICFLYHIELIFDYNYCIKNRIIDSKVMIEQICSTMKAIFMYKNMTINLKFQSHMKEVDIDYSIFEYLIINLTKFFHDNKNDNVQIHVIINSLGTEIMIRIIFLLQCEDYNYKMIHNLNEKYVFVKLIEYLKPGTYFYKYIEENTVTFDIFLKTNQIKETDSIILCNYNLLNYDDLSVIEENSNYMYELEIIIKERNIRRFSSKDIRKADSINTSTYNINDNLEIPNLDIKNVTYKIDDKYIFINVDDEESILRMNKRVFSKEDLTLNGCLDRNEFFNLLGRLHKDMSNGTIDSRLKIIAVMDHMVDCDLGWKIVETARRYNLVWDMDLNFILLSSTEGKDTIDLYEKQGMTEFVTKPLTRPKLKSALKKIYENNRNN